MNDIYKREDLLEIYKEPINRGTIDNPSVCLEQSNPMCGDILNIYLIITEGVLTDIKYEGDACAVSIISASLVTEELIGKTIGDLRNYEKKDVLELIGVPLSTSRIKCAMLILDGIKEAVKKYEQEDR